MASSGSNLLDYHAIRVLALGFMGFIDDKEDYRLGGTNAYPVSLTTYILPFVISFLAICGVQKNTLFSFQYFSRFPEENVLPVIVTVSFSVNPTILWQASTYILEFCLALELTCCITRGFE
jgi:hypothetical protein